MIWLLALALADDPPQKQGTAEGLRGLAAQAGFSDINGATGAPTFIESPGEVDDAPAGGRTDATPAVVGSGSSTENRGFVLHVYAPAGSVVEVRIGEFEATLSEADGVHSGELGRYPVGPPLRVRVDGVEVFTSDIELELDENKGQPLMRVRYQ